LELNECFTLWMMSIMTAIKYKYKVGDLVVDKDENLVGTITEVMPELLTPDDEVHEGPWYTIYWGDSKVTGYAIQHEETLFNCMVIE